MAVSAAPDTAFIGVTRMASNCILIKLSMLYSAFVFILLISVEGRLKSPLVVVYLYPGTCLMLKSNSRI